MKNYWTISALLVTLFLGCSQDEGAKLPTVEERTSEAVDNLKDVLTEPTNGWTLSYRPTNETGAFLILMTFNENGTVQIQSDVSANDGEFIDHTISYRIDSFQGLELIMETYGVFHYLFELEQNTFGGEFEFIFVKEDNEDLIFTSKTDASDITTLVFEPSGANDSDLISTEAIDILRQGIFSGDELAGIGGMGNFNFHIPSTNHTISVALDLEKRIIKLLGIAEGQDMNEIISTSKIANLNKTTSFSLQNESIVLDQSQTISFGGIEYEVTQIPIGNFSETTDSFCTGQQETIVNIAGNASFGNFTATSSPFQSYNGFQPDPDDLYGVTHFFIYDQDDNSISDQIEAVFQNVVAFQWYYNFEIDQDSLLNAVGFVTVDEFNNVDFFLRGFDVIQNGNYLQLSFNGKDLITVDNPTAEELAGLDQLTDEIFSGGNIYVMELLNIGGLFEFYNPCNKYKGFLF
ncbi:MAG: DUF4302 domain-containing protein [Cytophagales bacterium]|nr:DUF4302 domain-containing protein [Cytophagales bacterium]